MKQAFQMKIMLLSVLLCAIGFIGKAQDFADASNTTPCDVFIQFYAVDNATCAIVATDPGPHVIPAGIPTAIPITWGPTPPTAPYSIAAEVANVSCGFPGGTAGAAWCGYSTTAIVPSCSTCPASFLDNTSPVFAPGGGGHLPLAVHP